MARQSSLRCRVCSFVPERTEVQYCTECFGPLDVVLGPPAAAGPPLRARIEGGPASMWRYRDLLPFDEPSGADAVGWTPLVRAEAMGGVLGLDHLWLKDDTTNPSGSFKDRVVAAALGRALAEGRTVVACASTGNLARAAAGAARRAGMAAVVLVPGSLPRGEMAALAAAGATVVPVEGGYDGANRLASEASMADDTAGWAWLNVGLRPWYVEGSATVAHEIAEQLGWTLPGHVVAPIASGALLLSQDRAFHDLVDVGLVSPRQGDGRAGVALWGAQPGGCAPVAAAFAAGAADVLPVRPDTVATSLAMGDPPDGPEVLAAVRRTGGAVAVVPEGEIADAQALVTETEGISVEPAGGVTVAAVARLAREGGLPRQETVVAYLTGGSRPGGGLAPGSGPGTGSVPGMVEGQVTGSIVPTVSALAAALRGGLPGSTEDPSR